MAQIIQGFIDGIGETFGIIVQNDDCIDRGVAYGGGSKAFGDCDIYDLHVVINLGQSFEFEVCLATIHS